MDLEIVRHEGGVVSTWAESAFPGAQAALSGPGRPYSLDTDASRYLILGDETALPAVRQLLRALPTAMDVEAHVEVVSDEAVDQSDDAGGVINWHVAEPAATPGAALVAITEGLEALDPDAQVWAAGEAAAMQAIRTHLFDKLGVSRRQATVRGYWKPARS
jgi:NADPH-dependent ferric siderophore reductase